MNESKQFTTLDEYKEYLDKVAESNIRVANASAKLLRSDRNIDAVMADMSITEREFIEIIALCRQVNYNRAIGGANKAAENETDRLYAKNPWKFVEEFLQNADDCNYHSIPEISIFIDESKREQCSIEFCYNEEGFTRNDIWAITAFSESTKVNDTVKIQAEEGIFYKEKTGRKGKGFKSVFSLSAENVIVHIRSNGFSFKLDNNIGRIMPIWEEDPKRLDGKTHVIVELIKPNFSTSDIYPEFRRLFCIDNYEGIFASSPFLFMHRLRMVYVTRKNENGEETFITEYRENKERTKYKNKISLSSGKEVLAGIAKDGIYYEEQMQEGVITTLTGDDSFDIPIIRYTRMVEDDLAYRNYSIIAPVIKSDTVTKWQGGALFRTFPMSLHPIKMPMAIDAPFILNPDRSGIQYSPYKDEEGQQIGANTWNTEVANRLFEDGGVFEAFFLWLRTLEGIRVDCYMKQEAIMLFEDRNNSDGHGNTWIPIRDISSICHGYPVFHLFARYEDFVSYNDARIVNKDLFMWPCAGNFFRCMMGNSYQNCILSDIYIGSTLFRAKPIVESGFTKAMNDYIDIVEDHIGLESEEIIVFFNKQLYPYLKANATLITRTDGDAFKKMRIYLSRVKSKNAILTVREAQSDNIKWFHSDDGDPHVSINRYRVYESSPVNMSMISDEAEKILGKYTLYDYFGEGNQYAVASNCHTWQDAKDYIEAILHFGYRIDHLKVACLGKYVFSKKLDNQFNAFRESGVLETIEDDDVKDLSCYFDHNLQKTCEALYHMGVRYSSDYFVNEGTYLSFAEETIQVLSSNFCPLEMLADISRIRKQLKKKINTTYQTLKNCREEVLLYFLDESNGLLSTDSYAGICDEIQKNQEYWVRKDLTATEILIRAVAGAVEVLRSKESKTLSIRIEDVLSHCLEDCIIKIGKKNALRELIIRNDGFFDAIPDEEIIPRLSLLKCDVRSKQTTYYKGDLAYFGGKRIYLRDIKGGNVYLKCDAEGDYNTALEECVSKRFDADALKYIDEMEQQYKDVREQIIVPFFNRTGHDLSRTYDEIERRFPDYDKKQIIGILSWFRSQGYTNALGNGNINNEKEIEDDYRNDPWKFVYEFIQNVDDCSYTNKTPELQITISKSSNQITFDYNEDGFTLEDVKALTKFGDSNKRGSLDDLSAQSGVFDREKTGRKGRGFKSVFALPGDGIIVHVLSNGFSFKFVKRLGSIIPIWEEVEDATIIGTRIMIEGLADGYADMLIPEIKKMFGVNDLNNFFAVCPILYLRKLGKVSVISDENSFSVDIDVQNRKYTKEDFVVDGEIIAGIKKNGCMKNGVWETLKITVKEEGHENCFQAVRNSKMFMLGNKTRIASIFAPVIVPNTDIAFSGGALYSTLPLDEHMIPIPLSINTCFDTNSGRSALVDNAKNAKLISTILKSVLRGFYLELRKIPNIRIEKYIPLSKTIMFGAYKKIERFDLSSIIKGIPILRTFDGKDFVACKDAKVLPTECYSWKSPDLLCEYFDGEKDALIESTYSGLSVAKRVINLNNSNFAENLNNYLDALDFDAQTYIDILQIYVYSYIDRHYETILRSCRQDNKQATLNSMRIFVFEMANGSYIRECADAEKVWMEAVPEGCYSFGRFRSLGSGSLSGEYANKKWVRELHETTDFENAFNRESLNEKSIESWEQTKELIETVLYYKIKHNIKIPFLSNCVLSEDVDPKKNFFRDGYIETKNRNIVDHVIDQEDLISIADNASLSGSISLQELAVFIEKLGVKKPDDFFEVAGRNIYTLSSGTLALLESYCLDRETAGEVVSAIDAAFKNIKSGMLQITYDDLKACSAAVYSRIFEYGIIDRKMMQELATRFCESYRRQENDDYYEAYIRALDIVGKIPQRSNIVICLSQINKRRLGICLQNCKVCNPEDFSLNIIIDEDHYDYPSDEIDKALKWLDDENAVSISYEYYQINLGKAFGNEGESSNWFLFDDTKVLLHGDDAENCMLRFVQKRYKGKDASFSSLISIITEQNELKKPWTKSKKEYVEKLRKFRNDTLNKQKVLFPDYDKHLNDATGRAIDYVIPELLQNINDCKAGVGQHSRELEVSIDVQQGTMLLRYDEAGFDYSNVYSITAIGQSSKHDESEGEKGLGFKKVFSLFEKVEIYSNGFYFSLNAEKNTVPEWIGNKERQERYQVDGKTTMLFFTSGSNKTKLNEILDKWKNLANGDYVGNEMSPVFLKKIDSISVEGITERYFRKNMEKEFIFVSVPLLSFYRKILSVRYKQDTQKKIDDTIASLKTRRKCALMSPEEQNSYIEGLSVDLCIPKKIKENNKGKGCFYSTLPTETPLKSTVFINVPLELTTGRDGIIEDSEYNKAIFRLLFGSSDENSSIFNKLLEYLAEENRELFMLSYIMPNVADFVNVICNLTGEERKAINKGLEQLCIFKAYGNEELVSIESSFSVDKIIYQYLKDVPNQVRNIREWMQENSAEAEKLKLLSFSSADECEKTESFAKAVGSPRGRFPLVEEGRDLVLEYMSGEYGSVNGDDDSE